MADVSLALHYLKAPLDLLRVSSCEFVDRFFYAQKKDPRVSHEQHKGYHVTIVTGVSVSSRVERSF